MYPGTVQTFIEIKVARKNKRQIICKQEASASPRYIFKIYLGAHHLSKLHPNFDEIFVQIVICVDH